MSSVTVTSNEVFDGLLFVGRKASPETSTKLKRKQAKVIAIKVPPHMFRELFDFWLSFLREVKDDFIDVSKAEAKTVLKDLDEVEETYEIFMDRIDGRPIDNMDHFFQINQLIELFQILKEIKDSCTIVIEGKIPDEDSEGYSNWIHHEMLKEIGKSDPSSDKTYGSVKDLFDDM